MKRIFMVLLTTLIFSFTLNAVHQVHTDKNQLKLQEIKLRNVHSELEKLDQDYRTLEENKTKTEAEKQQEIEKLKQREQELQKQLEARRLLKESERKVYAAEAPKPPTAAPSGSCADWIRGAGIGDVANANELIRRESGCNPFARNKSSGACGVAQELPCGKSGCALGDGACQVKWMNSYVMSRYGSWANAVGFHNRNNWY